MAAVNHLQSAISLIHLVHGRENGQMFDVFDVSVRIGVDVRVETPCRAYEPRELAGCPCHRREYLPLPANL